jgi:hypothetical protein
MIVTMLDVDFENDELGETLANVHLDLEMLLLCYLIMYNEWSVIGSILYLIGLEHV